MYVYCIIETVDISTMYDVFTVIHVKRCLLALLLLIAFFVVSM